jgi:hypothetical protein
LYQVTANPPLPSATTSGMYWLPLTVSLTWNSGPTLVPALSNRCPITAQVLLASVSYDAHTTTKSPLLSTATLGP